MSAVGWLRALPLVAALEEQGDNHDLERPVSHWIYFAAAADRARFLESAQKLGVEL